MQLPTRKLSKRVPTKLTLGAYFPISAGCSVMICATSRSTVSISEMLRPSMKLVTRVVQPGLFLLTIPDTWVYADLNEKSPSTRKLSARTEPYPPSGDKLNG